MTEPKSLKELWSDAERGDVEAQVAVGDAMRTAGELQAAAYWNRRAAERGHIRAQVNLGVHLANGLGVEQDEAEAISWYRRAAEQGSAEALFNLGLLYRDTGRYSESAYMFQRGGALGHAEALASYAFALDRGLGANADSAAAIRCYHEAADLGSASALHNLGVKYSYGRGVPQDPEKGVAFYRAAVALGYAPAALGLGNAYASGDGVPQDDTEAVNWFRRAALQGISAAQRQLGISYASGRGVPMDSLVGFHWLALAVLGQDEHAHQCVLDLIPSSGCEVHDKIVRAIQGDAEAQAGVGFRLFHGNGIAADEEAANLWIHLAAQNGDCTAQATYGLILQELGGSAAESIVWLRKAADQGDPRALYHLGLREVQGLGLPVDLKTGMQHLIESSLAGHDEARSALDELVASLDKNQWPEILEVVHWPKVAFILGPFVDGHHPGLRKLQDVGDFSEQSLWYQYEHEVADLHFPQEGSQPLLDHLFGVKVSLHGKYIGLAHIGGEFGAAISMSLSDIRQENGLPVYWAPSEEKLSGIASMLAFDCARKWVRHTYVQVTEDRHSTADNPEILPEMAVINTARPSVPLLDAIWNRLGSDSAEETPDGFRREDHCGTTVLRFEKFLEKIPGFELLGIVEVETRFNREIVPELDEETLELINSRCVWGSFGRKGEELALTMQYSVYGQESAYRMASELIVRAFYEQSQMGAGILHHTVSPENREEIQASFAAPAEWPVPLEYDDYEEAAMVFRQHNFGCHASSSAFTVTVPFSEEATPQTSAFLRVTAHARHPVAGAGYLGTIVLPALFPPALCPRICAILNSGELCNYHFVPRMGAWGVRGLGDEAVYSIFVPMPERYGDLHQTVMTWLFRRAVWIQARFWDPEQKRLRFDR
jgi:TPR repeat protein